MSQSTDGSPTPTTLPEAIVKSITAWSPGLMRPILGFRRQYLPLLMVYFAYGALGIIDVSRDMWVKESLALTAAELAGIGVWLSLPWTVKMMFGQLVDSVPIFGSQRRSYILIGAVFSAAGMLTLAGAAGGWLPSVEPTTLRSRRDVDRGWGRDPGRRSGCDVDRGRIPRGPGR